MIHELILRAAEESPVTQDKLIVISATGVTMIVSLVIPILTGLLTRLNMPSKYKGLLTLALNFVSAFLTTAILADGTAVLSWQSVITGFFGFIVSVAMYLGIYKPAGITSSTFTPNSAQPTVKEVGVLADKGVK